MVVNLQLIRVLTFLSIAATRGASKQPRLPLVPRVKEKSRGLYPGQPRAVFVPWHNQVRQIAGQWSAEANRWAAQYLALHLRQLDGGNVEDVLIALGQFSDHNMSWILQFVKDGVMSTNELSQALTMLPLALSDRPQEQLSVLAKRKKELVRVTRRDVGEQKAAGVRAIDECVAEIRSKSTPDGR